MKFILGREVTDWALAERALDAIRHAISVWNGPRSAIARPVVATVRSCAKLSFRLGPQGTLLSSKIEAATLSRFSPYATKREDDYL